MAFSLSQHDLNPAFGGGSGTTVASSTLTAITTSQLVVGAVLWNRSSSQTLSSVKDNATPQNTYNLLTQTNASASTGIQMFWLFGPAGSPTILTATFSASVTSSELITTVWSGGTASSIDQQKNATGNSSSPTGMSILPTAANELVFAAMAQDAGASPTSVASPFTLIDGSGDGFGADADDVQTTATSVAATFTTGSTSGTWAVVEASFFLSGAAPAYIPPRRLVKTYALTAKLTH